MDLEGIVGKLRHGPYLDGRNRNTTWVKVLNPNYSQRAGRDEDWPFAKSARRLSPRSVLVHQAALPYAYFMAGVSDQLLILAIRCNLPRAVWLLSKTVSNPNTTERPPRGDLGGKSSHRFYLFPDTALMIASCKGYTNIVEILLRAGADPNRKGNEGHTALSFAAMQAHTETVKVLIAHGADVNTRDDTQWTPLMTAISGWSTRPYDVTKALIAAGADVNATDRNGETALFHLAQGHWRIDRRFEVLKLLLANGADVNIKSFHTERPTALDVAIENADRGLVAKLRSVGAKQFGSSSSRYETNSLRTGSSGSSSSGPQWIPSLIQPARSKPPGGLRTRR